MDVQSGIISLQSRARFVRIAVYAFLATHAAAAAGNLAEAFGWVDLVTGELAPLGLAVALSYIASFIAFVGSALIVSMWIYRAHANLRDTGRNWGDISAGWAIGWFFVPFANLVQPFVAMRELWFASHDDRWSSTATTPTVLTVWWGTWLVGNILSNVGGLAANSSLVGGGVVGTVAIGVLMVCAGALLRIVDEVTSAQSNGTLAAEAFA